VLPKPVKLRNSVFIPDLNFSKTFWKEIKRCRNLDLGREFPPVCVNEVIDKIMNLSYSKREIKKANQIKIHFEKNWNKFLDVSEKVFGSSFKNIKISEIYIIITRYGTVGSFKILKNGTKTLAYLSARVDLPKEEIFLSLLLMIHKYLIQNPSEVGEDKWFLEMATVDFLRKKTDFKKYMPKVEAKPTNINLSKLFTTSARYLKKLGLNFSCRNIFLDGNENLIVNGIIFDNLLTPKENLFLKTLVKNRGHVVGFDKMGNVIWKGNSYDKFSLYSLSKIVQNVRRKIYDAGIKNNVIYTLRGKGYLIR